MSPGSVLKQNSNPSPVPRHNFHGQQPFSSSERRNEKHRKSLPMKASSSSASTHPLPPRKTFFTPWNPKFLSSSELWTQVFRKSMVNVLQMAHTQGKWSTKFKIIWLRQHQQMRVISSHEGRELKSLIKTHMKWTARKVTSTVKYVLWALSRRSKCFQWEKGRQIIICDKRKR